MKNKKTVCTYRCKARLKFKLESQLYSISQANHYLCMQYKLETNKYNQSWVNYI